MADPPDIKEYARPRAESRGLHWPTFDRQIGQESGWEHWSAPGVVKTSYSGVAKGVGQLHKAYYPEEVWSDPYRNIDAAIDTMARNVERFGTYRKALAAFNWGPGNVGGYTDGAGRVHPAWDGTRAWRCPHEGVVAQCRTAQRDHYLDVILGPEWKEPNIEEPPMPPSSGVLYEDYRDPAPAGRFVATPQGIVLHGSRSGRAGNPQLAEYTGTANWEVNNPDGLGWHATVADHRVAVHLTPQEWGWHAKGASQSYLGVEFAQPTAADAITDAQVAALADWIKTRVLPAWPNLPLHFPSHAEVDRDVNGINQGKSDVFPLNDRRMDELRARIMVGLREGVPTVPEQPAFAVGPGILAAMQARGDAPATHEMYHKQGEEDMYSEAYGQSGSRYLYLFSINRVFRYDPAA